jgi:glutamyl-tRNA reductase
MSLLMIGCSHRNAPIALRERLAFNAEQCRRALEQIRAEFPALEAVLLSTCNRVELYTASAAAEPTEARPLIEFLAGFHRLDPAEVKDHLVELHNEEAVDHLFSVAASLDSMVVGEPQILAQVKQAYQTAVEVQSIGPLLHAAFQASLKTGRRIMNETTIQQRRVSIPSVAVGDFASQIFDHFQDKHTLVIGAGEMAEETIRYLQDVGVRDVTVVNRSPARAEELAARFRGRALPWQRLADAVIAADLIVSTTGAEEPIVRIEQFLEWERRRPARPLFVLDLAVPRDFDPAIGREPGVYLYSIDDLQEACQQNQRQRDKEMPAARRIIEQETNAFLGEMHRHAMGPVIRSLHEGWQKPKDEELRRLLNKLPQIDDHAREEISQSFDRLINKLLHPPMESLRHESRHGIPTTLLDALKRLFQLKD